MDILSYNRDAWDREVDKGNPWTIPVSPEQVAAARRGEWGLLLTPTIVVPRSWYPDPLAGKDVLCLASGGGQQGPILAAAGAHVTVFDNSPRQLASDRLVAEREGLDLRTVQGDMADLSIFSDASFDLIFHPVSNCFAPDVNPVWRECFRVLRPGGSLLAGFDQPFTYCLEPVEGGYVLRYTLPYSDRANFSDEAILQKFGDTPLEFGHTLHDQIGGQLRAGFVLTDLYEDKDPNDPLSTYFPQYIATRAVKPINRAAQEDPSHK